MVGVHQIIIDLRVLTWGRREEGERVRGREKGEREREEEGAEKREEGERRGRRNS